MNSLVAYGSDSEESENGGGEHQQRRQYAQQLSEAETGKGEPSAADFPQPELLDSAPGCELPPHLLQQQLVEPRAPRRQSDLYEDDEVEEAALAARAEDDSDTDMEETKHIGSGGEQDEEDEAEKGEREEEELLLMSASKLLTADQRFAQPSSGACTPAGYTPRASAYQQLDQSEDISMVEEEVQEDAEQSRGIVQMPPSPPGQCSPTLQRKFDCFFERKAAGWDPNAMIKARRDFKNPSLYETLVGLFEIDEKGTNFDPQVYDPGAFRPEDFYDELSDRQAALEAKRKRQQQLGTNVIPSGSAVENLSPAPEKAAGASRSKPALPDTKKHSSSSSSSKQQQKKASSIAGARRSRLDK